MIYLRDETPMILLGDGGAVALEIDWLEQSLEEAAFAAGYPDWPAADVARSVASHMLSQRAKKEFSFQDFTASVHEVLKGVGYSEICAHFLSGGLEVRYSLLDLAEDTTPGFELALFKKCADLCDRLLANGVVTRLRFDGLRPAIKHLLKRSHWCPGCVVLSDELVAFLRARLLKISSARPLAFSIR